MPPLVIVKVPPVRSGERQLAVARLRRQLDDLLLDLGEGLAVGVAHDRHDQPLLGADRDADVVVVLEDDLVALDLGVHPRERLQRADDRLGEEGHEAEADTVPLLEGFLARLAQVHHRGHVDLVEGRQHRRRLLRLDQPGGDGLAAAGHAHPLLAPIGCPRRRRTGAGAGATGLGAGAAARRSDRRGGVAAGAVGGVVSCRAATARTSSRVTRPPGPVPATALRSTLCSSASRRTAGAARPPDRRRQRQVGAGAELPRRRAAAARGDGCGEPERLLRRRRPAARAPLLAARGTRRRRPCQALRRP